MSLLIRGGNLGGEHPRPSRIPPPAAGFFRATSNAGNMVTGGNIRYKSDTYNNEYASREHT